MQSLNIQSNIVFFFSFLKKSNIVLKSGGIIITYQIWLMYEWFIDSLLNLCRILHFNKLCNNGNKTCNITTISKQRTYKITVIIMQNHATSPSNPRSHHRNRSPQQSPSLHNPLHLLRFFIFLTILTPFSHSLHPNHQPRYLPMECHYQSILTNPFSTSTSFFPLQNDAKFFSFAWFIHFSIFIKSMC